MPDEPAPAPEESRGVRFIRQSFRSYRDGPIRADHPLLCRVLRAGIGPHQRVRLHAGLSLDLDLSIPLQETALWTDGDLEPQLRWAIREFLPRDGVCVDCGMNSGLSGFEARYRRRTHA